MGEILEWFKILQASWNSNHVMINSIFVAFLGCAIAAGITRRAALRGTEDAIKDQAKRWEGKDSIEINTRQIRQDIAGIMTMLQITNMILGGILAILIYSLAK